jgi:excisionase family DNA binding protein
VLPASDDEHGAKRSTRRKKGQRYRKPVVAIEPSPRQLALTVPEVAWLLRVSPNTVWNLLSEAKLSSFTVNRRRLIARSSVEEFIGQGGTGAAPSQFRTAGTLRPP